MHFATGWLVLAAGIVLGGLTAGRVAQVLGTLIMAGTLWRTPSSEITQWAAWAKHRTGIAGPFLSWMLGALGTYRGGAFGTLLVGVMATTWQFWPSPAPVRVVAAPPPVAPPAVVAQPADTELLSPLPPLKPAPTPPAAHHPAKPPAPVSRPAWVTGPRPAARTPEAERVPQFDDPDLDPRAAKQAPAKQAAPSSPRRDAPDPDKDPDLERMEKAVP
jgi:hypothetical protein